MGNQPILILCLISCLTILVESAPKSLQEHSVTLQPSDGPNTPLDFKYVGTVGNKSYFSSTSAMKWHLAREYCRASNFTLASIETAAEWNFLEEVPELQRNGCTWTSARESPSTLIWDAVGGFVDGSIIRFTGSWDTENAKCLAIRRIKTEGTYIFPCGSSCYVYCQLKQ